MQNYMSEKALKEQAKTTKDQQKTAKKNTKKSVPKKTAKNFAKVEKSVNAAAQPKKQSTNKRRSYTKKQQGAGKKPALPIKISFLGGLNEVGKNMTVVEYGDDIIIIDSGLSFPDEDMPGIDLVIPDFTYVEKNAGRVRGIVITHGHEDHIGSLAYLLKSVNVPIYGTRLTIGLIQGKLREHNLLDSVKLNTVNPGMSVKLGGFEVEFIHVNHSIPDAVGFGIKCEGGTIVHTGDFKIDTTPIDGGMIDIARFAELGKEGVLCMMSDSTNAERPGYTESERKVGEAFKMLFRKAGQRRIIVATFASNIHRVQQIIDVAASLGRKVALSGRSLENVVAISEQLGYLHVPEGILITLDMVNKYMPEDVVLITTGSQGEPMSALTRMAFSDHRKISVGPEDYVIISATPIPGNEKMVGKVINELMKLGAEVVYEKMYDVHVSGHACGEELKMMLGVVKPKYFVPVHGERKHLQKHALLAQSMGIDSKNIVLADNGTQLEVSDDFIRFGENVPAGRILVDGLGVGDVGSVVLRDRKLLAKDGLLIVVATLDSVTGELLSGPDIVSRGFVYMRESEALIEEAKDVAYDTLMWCREKNIREWGAIKLRIRDDVSKLMFERTKRNPMILPMIMHV